MKYFILLLFVLFGSQSWSQSYKFGMQWGIGSYSMSDLKTINDLATPNIPFDTKIVSNFPLFFYYRPTFLMVFDDYSVGLVNTFQSTGSRISAKDYSGEYRFDMKVNSNCPGIYFERNISSYNNVQVLFYTILGCSFSKLTINEYYNVFDSTITNDNIKFKSLNFYCEPGINLKYPMKPFCIGLNSGYFVSFGKQAFYTDNNKDHILSNSRSNKPITPDWNGFRLGLSLYYILNNE